MSANSSPLSIEERRAILDREIKRYVKRGFRVISRTDTTAQLVKPKKFSFFWAFIWFLVLIVGFVIYLLYYVSKKDETIYLEVDERGRIKRLKN